MPRRKTAQPELAILFEGLNPPNLQIARDVLKMAGIRSWVRDENLSRMVVGISSAHSFVKLLVRRKDYVRAREVLKKFKPD